MGPAVSYFNHIFFDKVPSDIYCWIAGGALRDYFMGYRSTRSDLDVFFEDSTDLEIVRDWILRGDCLTESQKEEAEGVWAGAEMILETENAVKIKADRLRIDLVKRFFPSPQKTIELFDFTVCCAAVDQKGIYCHDRFFQDLAGRRLVINSLPFPVSTLQRLQKYLKKGFFICNGGLLEIVKALRGMPQEEMDQNSIEFYPDGSPRFVKID